MKLHYHIITVYSNSVVYKFVPLYLLNLPNSLRPVSVYNKGAMKTYTTISLRGNDYEERNWNRP